MNYKVSKLAKIGGWDWVILAFLAPLKKKYTVFLLCGMYVIIVILYIYVCIMYIVWFIDLKIYLYRVIKYLPMGTFFLHGDEN